MRCIPSNLRRLQVCIWVLGPQLLQTVEPGKGEAWWQRWCVSEWLAYQGPACCFLVNWHVSKPLSHICYQGQSASVLPSATVHKKLFETLSLNTSVLSSAVCVGCFCHIGDESHYSMFRGFKGSWDAAEQNDVWCLYHKNQVLEGLPDVCVLQRWNISLEGFILKVAGERKRGRTLKQIMYHASLCWHSEFALCHGKVSIDICPGCDGLTEFATEIKVGIAFPAQGAYTFNPWTYCHRRNPAACQSILEYKILGPGQHLRTPALLLWFLPVYFSRFSRGERCLCSCCPQADSFAIHSQHKVC